MKSLWMSKACIKNTASSMNWIFVCVEGWDLSKKVLWVSVGQLAENLQAVKVCGQKKKILPLCMLQSDATVPGWVAEFLPTDTHSTSLERSHPP